VKETASTKSPSRDAVDLISMSERVAAFDANPKFKKEIDIGLELLRRTVPTGRIFAEELLKPAFVILRSELTISIFRGRPRSLGVIQGISPPHRSELTVLGVPPETIFATSFNRTDLKWIKSHLYKLKAERCVKDSFVTRKVPLNYQILCHEWQLTNKGKRFLREGGLQLPLFQHDGSLPASKANVESSRDKTTGIMFSRGGPNSEINFLRANQAATILHAFSLVQKTSRLR